MNRLGTILAVIGALLTVLQVVATVASLDLPLQLGVIGPALVIVGVGLIAYGRRRPSGS